MSWVNESDDSRIPPLPPGVFVTRDYAWDRYDFFYRYDAVPFLSLNEETVVRENKRLIFSRIHRALELRLTQDTAREIEVPSDAEPSLMGWRVFKVVNNRLYPYSARTPWRWDLNTAYCTVSNLHYVGNPNESSAVPVEGCTCGFWAYRSYDLMRRHGPRADVTALVAVGGDMVEAEWGVRGSHARVVAFLKDADYAKFGHILDEHKPEHIPVLPMAECEMLAFDMGLDWKLPPPPPVPEVAQYVGLRKLKDPEPWEEAFYYPRSRDGWVPYLLFSKPEDVEARDPAYYGPLQRIDDYIVPGGKDTSTLKIRIYGVGNERKDIELRKSWIRYQQHECEVWALASGNLERDKALADAQIKYGTEWLRRYER